MLANNGSPVTPAGASSWAVLMLVVSYLMVSNVRYRTFKKMKSKRQAALLFVSVASVFVILSRLFQPGLAFAMILAAYVTLGLVEEVVFFRSRRLADRLLVGAPVDPQEVPAGEQDEEEAHKLA
jgi:CDP-diacylglycerol--serine O-phosphatidyltransferase